MSKEEKKYESLNIDGTVYKTRLSKKFKDRVHYELPDISKIYCFISGTILEVLVEVGQEVEEGDDLLVLEAMKMKNRIKTPAAGKIRRIEVKEGEKVTKGKLLVVLI